jgi:hypothetical protein
MPHLQLIQYELPLQSNFLIKLIGIWTLNNGRKEGKKMMED